MDASAQRGTEPSQTISTVDTTGDSALFLSFDLTSDPPVSYFMTSCDMRYYSFSVPFGDFIFLQNQNDHSMVIIMDIGKMFHKIMSLTTLSPADGVV